MSNAITDLLESANILASSNGDNMLCYRIDMAIHEACENRLVLVKAKAAT